MTDISTPEYNTYFQGMDYMTEILTPEIKHIFRDWGVAEITTPKSNTFSVSLTMTEMFCPPIQHILRVWCMIEILTSISNKASQRQRV